MLLTKIEDLLKEGIDEEIFTGATVGLFLANDSEYILFKGKTDTYGVYDIGKDTFYDLASLTKPLVTALSIASLIDKNKLKLTTTLEDLYPDVAKDKKNINIRDLLKHRSGLQAHIKFYENNLSYAQVIDKILNSELADKDVKGCIYSDLGYILLGDIIEKISGLSLEKFWFEHIAKPLGVEEYFVFSGNVILKNNNCAATTNIVDKDVKYCGIVHDDNCQLLGGCSGHAGLFGKINGILKLLKSVLNSLNNKVDLPFCKVSIMEEMWTKSGNERFVCGFDTPSKEYSSSGTCFGLNSIGHLGFTGTSFWIDIDKSIIIILLTNRAIYLNSLRKMKKFRPKFHDYIMKF